MGETTPTEHLLNAGRRPQTSQRARNTPSTWVGQKKKQGQKNRHSTCSSGRELWRNKSFHTLGSPLTGGDGGWAGEHFRAMEESTATEVQRAESKVERFLQRGLVPTTTHQPKRLVCSPTGVGGGWKQRLWLWRSDPGRGLGLAAWTQPEGG